MKDLLLKRKATTHKKLYLGVPPKYSSSYVWQAFPTLAYCRLLISQPAYLELQELTFSTGVRFLFVNRGQAAKAAIVPRIFVDIPPLQVPAAAGLVHELAQSVKSAHLSFARSCHCRRGVLAISQQGVFYAPWSEASSPLYQFFKVSVPCCEI